MPQNRAYSEILEHYADQFAKLENEARSCVKKTAKLWNKESDIFLQQISKMEDEHQKRTAELSSLADKVARDSDVLRKELENVKPSSPKDDEEAAELRRQLAQSDTDLCALRASNRELSEKMTNLEEQLAEYVASGKAAAAKVEDLEERRRC